MNTNNLNIPLVVQSQAQKEVTINEAICTLEALQNRGVIDKDLSAPPGSPSPGDAYIVGASATGAWVGKEKNVAYYNSGWKFIAPKEGLLVWVNDENKLYYYSGSAWAAYSDNLNNLAMLGVNTSADSTNKLAVSSGAVLFNHNGSSVQTKLNKNSSGDTASFLYQSNWSGRAEIGLCGDDNFHFKVSPDGSSWYDSMVINRNNGDVTFLNPQIKTAVKASADSTNSTLTYAAVDGLSFSLPAGKIYLAEFYLAYIAVGTATGIDVSIGLPSGASIIAGDASGASAATAAQVTQMTGDKTSSGTFSATYSTTINSLVKISAVINSGSTGGTLQPYFRSETNGFLVTVRQYSSGRLTYMADA